MVNNNQLIDDKDIYRKVGYANELKCSKCKKIQSPNDNEISFKNPNYYYKNCLDCRTKMNDYLKKKAGKINLTN